MCENNHKSLIIQHFRELLGHLALFYLVIWRYFTWSFGVYLVFLLYRLKKVDTEKIFQLNNFSKVDNMSFPEKS